MHHLRVHRLARCGRNRMVSPEHRNLVALCKITFWHDLESRPVRRHWSEDTRHNRVWPNMRIGHGIGKVLGFIPDYSRAHHSKETRHVPSFEIGVNLFDGLRVGFFWRNDHFGRRWRFKRGRFWRRAPNQEKSCHGTYGYLLDHSLSPQGFDKQRGYIAREIQQGFACKPSQWLTARNVSTVSGPVPDNLTRNRRTAPRVWLPWAHRSVWRPADRAQG